MAKDDYTCDVCGGYAPNHEPDCYFGVNSRRKRAEAERTERKDRVIPRRS